jgi:hypothetical protein
VRAALALYALRFGGWLLAKTSGGPVVVTFDIPGFSATRRYGWEEYSQ